MTILTNVDTNCANEIIKLISPLFEKNEMKNALNDFVEIKYNKRFEKYEIENIIAMYRLIHGNENAKVLHAAIIELEQNIEKKSQQLPSTFLNRTFKLSRTISEMDKHEAIRWLIAVLITGKLIGTNIEIEKHKKSLKNKELSVLYNKYQHLLPADVSLQFRF
jgi:hypothetical protein